MLISSLNVDQLSRSELTKLLFGSPPQDNRNGDCIFVFGGSTEDRATTAVNLFKASRAPYILFTGGAKWGQRFTPEAVEMQQKAIDMGVPRDRILVECDSNNTKENVLASLLVIDRRLGLHNIRRLLIVSSPGHMRRCMLTLRTYMPAWIDFVWCPDGRPQGQPDNWWKDPQEASLVYKEARSLIQYIREGQLIDEDIDL